MPTVMDRHRPSHITSTRDTIQKTTISVGIFLVALGMIGVVLPGLLGLHLSFAHNFIHLIAGSVGIWSGYSETSKNSFTFSIGFGMFFGLIGLAGFVFGEPGYPGVGYMEADGNLLRIFPNILEMGTMDHILHLFISAILVYFTFSCMMERNKNGRTVVNEQAKRGKNGNI